MTLIVHVLCPEMRATNNVNAYTNMEIHQTSLGLQSFWKKSVQQLHRCIE